jgi:hypothetical protein
VISGARAALAERPIVAGHANERRAAARRAQSAVATAADRPRRTAAPAGSRGVPAGVIGRASGPGKGSDAGAAATGSNHKP